MTAVNACCSRSDRHHVVTGWMIYIGYYPLSNNMGLVISVDQLPLTIFSPTPFPTYR
jgi:hypothetical protein